MTKNEAVKLLAVIGERHQRDPEQAHALADDVLLAYVPDEVCTAYKLVVAKCAWWGAA